LFKTLCARQPQFPKILLSVSGVPRDDKGRETLVFIYQFIVVYKPHIKGPGSNPGQDAGDFSRSFPMLGALRSAFAKVGPAQ